jgi:hypothetical protein
MDDERSAHKKMRRAVDALVASPEPIHVRLQAAEKHFGQLRRESELPAPAEQDLYHRIASNLVSGGDEEEEDYDEETAVAESIAALDEDLAVTIARDMLRLYELVADPPDLEARWPPEWPPA